MPKVFWLNSQELKVVVDIFWQIFEAPYLAPECEEQFFSTFVNGNKKVLIVFHPIQRTCQQKCSLIYGSMKCHSPERTCSIQSKGVRDRKKPLCTWISACAPIYDIIHTQGRNFCPKFLAREDVLEGWLTRQYGFLVFPIFCPPAISINVLVSTQ